MKSSPQSPTNKQIATNNTSSVEGSYLSVSDVTRLVNDTLELQFPQLLFRGEISQITVAPSGHVYFSIKDEGATLSCALWAGVARTLSFKPRVGMSVRCHGRPNVYPASGRFQIVVHRLFEDGEGELQRRFLELRRRLDAEGFFAPERKRPLPMMPQAVGIVTSRTGAVIHDMMVKLRERFPSMVVYLADTRVQGEGAASEIASAIRRLDRSGLVDVIIVARGGGSLEDLWAFNEEEVVKAVFASSRPIVSGVGHEVDVTLCDLAADVRAPTPTAAAEIVVPKVGDLLQRIGDLERRLRDVDRWLQPRVQRLDELSVRLEARLRAVSQQAGLRVRAAELSLARIRPDKVIELLRARYELLQQRLRRGFAGALRVYTSDVTRFGDRLQRAIPSDVVARHYVTLNTLTDRMKGAGRRVLETATLRVVAAESRLLAVSPQAVLERGYSIVTIGGRHVRTATEVAVGDRMEVRIFDGIIEGTVSSHRRIHGKDNTE